MQSNLINMDTEGAIESPHINGVSVLSGLNLEKINGRSYLSPGTKQIAAVYVSYSKSMC